MLTKLAAWEEIFHWLPWKIITDLLVLSTDSTGSHTLLFVFIYFFIEV